MVLIPWRMSTTREKEYGKANEKGLMIVECGVEMGRLSLMTSIKGNRCVGRGICERAGKTYTYIR